MYTQKIGERWVPAP